METQAISPTRSDRAPWPPDQRLALSLGPALALIVLALFLTQPLPQPLAYHRFHDTRPLVGIPNVWNVASNLPFAAIGAAGLAWLARAATMPAHLVRCYQVMFASILLTAFGSTYYHWAPDNASLVWDRLPIAAGFMGMFAGFAAERLTLPPKATLALLAVLSLGGALSVAYWAAFDDLRLYLIAQFYPLLTIPVLLWLMPAQATRGIDWLVAIGFYAAGKAFEALDGPVYALGGIMSGHTIKHTLAAAGVYWLLRMLQRAWPRA